MEAFFHRGRQVLGRILQCFPGKATQVRFYEPDDAALIRAAELPQDPAHTRLSKPLLASEELGAVVEHHLGEAGKGLITLSGEIDERHYGGTALPHAVSFSPL